MLCVPSSLLCTIAKITRGFFVKTESPMRPVWPGRPPASFFHVAPASVLR